MLPEPAINVVVYAEPGPPDSEIEAHARTVLDRKRVGGTGGGLGYLVLVSSDMDRLWAGVDRGDALGTAAAVLHFVGGSAHQFIDREEDFIYGWVGEQDPVYGRVLLLQIFPRPHMLAAREAESN